MPYANFYDKKDKCKFSVIVKDEKQAESLANEIFVFYSNIEDWTYTEKPISKKVVN